MKKSIFIILIVIGLGLPIFVWAQGILSGPLVPCGTAINPNPCTLCDIFKVAKNIIDFLLLIIFFVATIFIVIGGIRMLTSAGSPEHVDRGKRMITAAIVGVIIALVSWILLAELFIALVGEQTAEGGNVEQGFPWPWNEIQCTGGGITPPPEIPPSGSELVYCVCEYSNNQINATLISGYEDNWYNCQQRCTSSSSTTYCAATFTGEANLYCALGSSSSLSRQTACMLRQRSYERVGTSCYDTFNNCNNAIDNQFRSTCYVDGNLMCHCNTDAPEGLTDPCTSSGLPLAIFKYSEGRFVSCYNNVLTCSSRVGIGCDFCRLGCPSGEVPPPAPQWCTRSSSKTWPIAGINPNQRGDASGVLANFLDCLYLQPDMDTGHPITSISDDRLCNNTCIFSGGTCSTACSHVCSSAHYGCGPSSFCYGYSYAVDIDIANGSTDEEPDVNHAAYNCAQTLWGATIKCLGPSNDPANHNNHVHISISAARGCGWDSVGAN